MYFVNVLMFYGRFSSFIWFNILKLFLLMWYIDVLGNCNKIWEN